MGYSQYFEFWREHEGESIDEDLNRQLLSFPRSELIPTELRRTVAINLSQFIPEAHVWARQTWGLPNASIRLVGEWASDHIVSLNPYATQLMWLTYYVLSTSGRAEYEIEVRASEVDVALSARRTPRPLSRILQSDVLVQTQLKLVSRFAVETGLGSISWKSDARRIEIVWHLTAPERGQLAGIEQSSLPNMEGATQHVEASEISREWPLMQYNRSSLRWGARYECFNVECSAHPRLGIDRLRRHVEVRRGQLVCFACAEPITITTSRFMLAHIVVGVIGGAVLGWAVGSQGFELPFSALGLMVSTVYATRQL